MPGAAAAEGLVPLVRVPSDDVAGLRRANNGSPGPPTLMSKRKSSRFRGGLQALRPCDKAAEGDSGEPAPVSTHGITQLIRGLYLGGAHDAVATDELGTRRVTHIVNLTPESQVEQLAGFEYLCVDVLDHSDAPIREHFERAFAFIDAGRSAGGGVLVLAAGASAGRLRL